MRFLNESILNISRKVHKFSNINRDLENSLTHSFRMHPFSTPWKHQKTLRFSDVFRGWRKDALGTNRLIKLGKWSELVEFLHLVHLPSAHWSLSFGTEHVCNSVKSHDFFLARPLIIINLTMKNWFRYLVICQYTV